MESYTNPDQTSIAYRGDGSCLDQVYNALVTSPNLTSLDLDFTFSGCDEPSDLWLFDFREGDRFPPLERLRLSDYDLKYDSTWPTDNWRWEALWMHWAQGVLTPMYRVKP
jgi:hypothetical protein